MKNGGFFTAILGVFLIFFGFKRNYDIQNSVQLYNKWGNTNPGNMIIIFGVLLVIVAIVLFVLNYIEKMNSKPR